jgi:hypothetical protein
MAEQVVIERGIPNAQIDVSGSPGIRLMALAVMSVAARRQVPSRVPKAPA